MALGANRVIITDGENGGIAAERHEDGDIVLWLFPSLPVTKAVDTTGAGDIFRAGVCWGMLQADPPWPLNRLVRVASAAAALHVQVLGSGSRPPLDAVLRLAEFIPQIHP
jgi:sugar/nucleoside kinase (ribokinase family)